MSINIIIQFGWRLGKGKLFWFLLTSLHFLSVFVNASHFRVGFCVGKNQMCLPVRWLFLYAAQWFGSRRCGGFTAQNCQYTTKVDARQNVQLTTAPAIEPNAC